VKKGSPIGRLYAIFLNFIGKNSVKSISEGVMGRLLIIDTCGQGKVVLDCAKNFYDSITFMTNDKKSLAVEDYPIIYEPETAFDTIIKNYDEIIAAIGNNNARLKISLEYESKGMKLAKIIHPKAVVSGTAEIGDGTVVFA
jgi:hypothetical protein